MSKIPPIALESYQIYDAKKMKKQKGEEEIERVVT